MPSRRTTTEAALGRPRQAAGADPQRLRAGIELGLALDSAGRLEEALAAFDDAVQVGPGVAYVHYLGARALHRVGRPLEALARLDHALSLSPALGEAWYERGQVLVGLIAFGMNRRSDAERCLRRAMELGVDRDSVLYLLATIDALRPGESAPAASPRAYVRGLFDRYAESYDAHLTETLQYRVPALLTGALVRVVDARTDLDIVDLGCGTGLCGPALAASARRLVGVDLSEKMLEQARRRGVYHDLVCADLVEFLRDRPRSTDAAVAADVFVYVGDLQPVFAATAAALRPRGVFAFSVEAYEGGADYRLRMTHRFAHAVPYLERLAREQGFVVRECLRTALRNDSAGPVEGAVLVLQRP